MRTVSEQVRRGHIRMHVRLKHVLRLIMCCTHSCTYPLCAYHTARICLQR